MVFDAACSSPELSKNTVNSDGSITEISFSKENVSVLLLTFPYTVTPSSAIFNVLNERPVGISTVFHLQYTLISSVNGVFNNVSSVKGFL